MVMTPILILVYYFWTSLDRLTRIDGLFAAAPMVNILLYNVMYAHRYNNNYNTLQKMRWDFTTSGVEIAHQLHFPPWWFRNAAS